MLTSSSTPVIKTISFLLLLASVYISCKKESDANDSLRSLLIVSPDKVWQLKRGQDSDYWQLNSNGWAHYVSNEGAPYLFSNCVTSANYFALHRDGSYEPSIYTCDLYAPTSTTLVAQDESMGTWSLNNDRTLTLGNEVFRLVSVTPSELVISNTNKATLYYNRVTALPFSTRNEQIAGTTNKTWKYRKLEYNYSEDPLTPKQVATRLTYMPDGSLTVSYTDATFGQPVTGSWALKQLTFYPSGEINQYALTNTIPPSADILLENLDQSVTELSDKSMILSYKDASLNNTKLYMIPE